MSINPDPRIPRFVLVNLAVDNIGDTAVETIQVELRG